jgi:hypothetical protein
VVAQFERLSGLQTIRIQFSASGFNHESDAVIARADLTVHLELKYLSQEVTKNDLVIFNQKGLDFLAGSNANLRRTAFYRVLLSGVSSLMRRGPLHCNGNSYN